MLCKGMTTPRTIPSKGSSEKGIVSLRDNSNPTQTLGKSVPSGIQSVSVPSSSGSRDGSEGHRKVKKVKKRSKPKKGTRENDNVPSLKGSFRKGSLKEETPSEPGFRTRDNVSDREKCFPVQSEKLTVSVWDEDVTSDDSPRENDIPSQTLEIKSRTCNYIVTHRGKKRLCWRECYKNHNVCIRHYPRQQCSFKEERDGEWYYCERKTKTEYCTYHSKGNRDQCKGFTIDSDMRKRCTMKRIRGSNFCKKHVDQPPDATICGAPKGKTVCKVVTSRGSYCREHSSLPGRSTNYGTDSRVDVLNERLWGLFKQYKDSGNQKYLGVMTKHKESRVKLE
tara:strand:- start:309 stop:1316 length:1008 start_codon:yes stop_codon:yes gene_type:complete